MFKIFYQFLHSGKPIELPTANYLHMDVVEPEKLAWTEEAPESNLKEVKLTHRLSFATVLK